VDIPKASDQMLEAAPDQVRVDCGNHSKLAADGILA
jgi:hypothetical protein